MQVVHTLHDLPAWSHDSDLQCHCFAVNRLFLDFFTFYTFLDNFVVQILLQATSSSSWSVNSHVICKIVQVQLQSVFSRLCLNYVRFSNFSVVYFDIYRFESAQHTNGCSRNRNSNRELILFKYLQSSRPRNACESRRISKNVSRNYETFKLLLYQIEGHYKVC